MKPPISTFKPSLSVVPNPGDSVKPAALIEIEGEAQLTLTDCRIYNILLKNAYGPELGVAGHEFEIPLSELIEAHESNDSLIQSIEALMTTPVTIQRADGSTDRVQLLGGNNLTDPSHEYGMLRYAIPSELGVILRDATVFAKLQLEVL